nr:TadE/TadG family type IV pilus assembly protein [Kineosporia rhizophila]
MDERPDRFRGDAPGDTLHDPGGGAGVTRWRTGGVQPSFVPDPVSPHAGDRGALALELAICAPVVIVMLLVVVALGRVTHGQQLIQDAAAASARAASLAPTAAVAEREAVTAASASLAGAGMTCIDEQAQVDTTQFVAGGQVEVTVTCHSNLSQLSMTGLPGRLNLTATSRAPVDPLRQIGTP